MKDQVQLVCQQVVKNYPNCVGAQETCSLWFRLSLNFCMQTFFSTPQTETSSIWKWFQKLYEQILGVDGLEMRQLIAPNQPFNVQPLNLTVGSCHEIMNMVFEDFLVLKDEKMEDAEIKESKVEVPYLEFFVIMNMAVFIIIFGFGLVWRLSSYLLSPKFYKNEDVEVILRDLVVPSQIHLKSTFSQTEDQKLSTFFGPEIEMPCEMLEDVDASCLNVLNGFSGSDSDSLSSVCSVFAAPLKIQTVAKLIDSELLTKTEVIAELHEFSVRRDDPPADSRKLPTILEEPTLEVLEVPPTIVSPSRPISKIPHSLKSVVSPVISPPKLPGKLKQISKIPNPSKLPSKINNIVNLKRSRSKTNLVESVKKSLLRPPQNFKNTRRFS